jgi:hypothetical protein
VIPTLLSPATGGSAASGPDALINPLGTAIVVLLIVLLVERELLRAFGSFRASHRVRTLNVLIFPLLPICAVIVAARIAYLLPR